MVEGKEEVEERERLERLPPPQSCSLTCCIVTSYKTVNFKRKWAWAQAVSPNRLPCAAVDAPPAGSVVDLGGGTMLERHPLRVILQDTKIHPAWARYRPRETPSGFDNR